MPFPPKSPNVKSMELSKAHNILSHEQPWRREGPGYSYGKENLRFPDPAAAETGKRKNLKGR